MKQIRVENLSLEMNAKDIITLYITSFSLFEKIPYFIVKRRLKQKKYILYKYIDNNDLIGISIIFNYKHYTLIHYIIVKNKYKHKGYGSRILALLKDTYPNNNIFLSCKYFNSSKDEVKIKRYNFYIKNGFINNDFIVKEYAVKYFIMSTKKMNRNEYRLVINHCFNKILAKLFFK